MHFALWLEGREQAHSWLSPSGEFHPLGGSDTHYTWSQRKFRKSPGEMFKEGWARVQYYGESLYANNDFLALSNRQRSALIDLAIVIGATWLIYEKGDRQQTIWGSGDR
jgi:hypothetical protein